MIRFISTNSMHMHLRKFQEKWKTEMPGMLESMGSQGVIHDLVTEQQSMFGQTYGPIFEEWKINLITDLILSMVIYLFISLFFSYL